MPNMAGDGIKKTLDVSAWKVRAISKNNANQEISCWVV